MQMEEKISTIVKDAFSIDASVTITRPDVQFGDYATNVAMQLAKPLGKSPRDIANLLAAKLQEDDDFQEVTVAGPGFINIRVQDAKLMELAGRLNDSKERLGKKIVIETNNPNPFKAMHVGHAFNAILADTIANLLAADGADLHRVSYHGDIGSHVGKSMWAILRYLDGDIAKLHAIQPAEQNAFMSKMYASGAKAYKEDETAKAAINDLARQSFTLEDPFYREVYETCRAWSFEQLDAIVALLGNAPTERKYLESEADALGVETVRNHIGDVFIESDGALVFPGSKYGSFDNVFVGSNGYGLYGARDVGLMRLKNDDYHAEKSYIITAEEQRAYFKGAIKAAEMCLPDLEGVTVNIPTGTMLLSTGKMSSRTGEVVEISWLFDQIRRAIADRGGEATPDIIAGALRYQFLKIRIGSDVVFDIEEAVSLHGNTGSYLQYAYARARSILNKATTTGEWKGEPLNEYERNLVRKMTEFTDVVTQAKRELLPHYICTYLYELAQEFNRFYEKNKVIGSDEEKKRLFLVARYAETLKNGLTILSIAAPEKM